MHNTGRKILHENIIDISFEQSYGNLENFLNNLTKQTYKKNLN